jgi:hypothetical protein
VEDEKAVFTLQLSISPDINILVINTLCQFSQQSSSFLNSVNSEEVLAHGQTEWKVIYM